MPTTLLEEYQRANEPQFVQSVRAALFRIVPDIIGETVGTVVNGVALTQAAINKRHDWASDFLRNPDAWMTRLCPLVAGEPQVRNVPAPGLPADNIIQARAAALVSDCAGVKAGE